MKLIAEDIIISSSSSPLFSDIKNIHTSADDGWGYAGMQNIDIGLAPLVVYSICAFTDGTEPKMRPGPSSQRPAESGRAGPGRAGPHFRPIADWVLLAWLSFRLGPLSC